MKEVNFVEIVQLFKALADETRIRMLNLLKNGELCVCDIEEVLDIQQSNASRHLNKLKVGRAHCFCQKISMGLLQDK